MRAIGLVIIMLSVEHIWMSPDYAAIHQRPVPEFEQTQTLVDVWCGGDDNLTRGVCNAVVEAFASSPDFHLSSEEKAGTLVVTIPTNVDWKKIGKRTRVFYKVEFTSVNDRKLGARKGTCWESEFANCANQVIKQARIVARKVRTKH